MSGGDPMKPANPDVKLTYDDYVRFPDDGLRHELIDGEHYLTPTPIRKRQAVSANLLGSIWNYLRENRVGRVFDAIDGYRLMKGRYLRMAQLTLEAGDVLTTPLLPGLTLPLSTIFED
jgi:Uma2 family endonuclease